MGVFYRPVCLFKPIAYLENIVYHKDWISTEVIKEKVKILGAGGIGAGGSCQQPLGKMGYGEYFSNLVLSHENRLLSPDEALIYE